MKKIALFAIALISLAGCTNDEFVGDPELGEANGQTPISFSSGLTTITRADKTGSEAATDLNEQFYVYGIKNEVTDQLGAAGDGNLVYKNYVVKWVDNSAYTTTSNTKGWEYVGYTLDSDEQSNITPNSGNVPQTIKYWDFGAEDYTFYAFSALPADITAGNVKVAKIENVASGTVYDKGYTVTLTAAADLNKLYFAERVNVTASNNTDRTEVNTYGGNVTFRFHNTATKVRVAMFETIPGYTVTINKFSVDNDGADPAFSDMTDEVTDNFAANLQYSAAGVAGTMTVTYDATETATKNYPIVAFTPSGSNGPAKVLALGSNLKESTVLGESSSEATYDKEDKTYTSVFPNEANTQNLKLKLSYTLTAPDTGETITITDATAEVPATYLQWKPGFAYTYIFKISDNTNGQSGQGVTGLYPITFDAVEVVAEDGQAEYITTVSEPSITTFGVDGDGKYVSGGNEYAAGSDIYVTIVAESAVVTPKLGTNVNLYKNVATSDSNFPVTEASLAEAIAETGGSAGEKITYTLDNTIGTVVTKVPGEDGVEITQNAVKMAGLAAGTYAVEYIPQTGNKVYKVIVVQ